MAAPVLLGGVGAGRGFGVDVCDGGRGVHLDRRVSSTGVREALSAGDISTAARLLGRAPSVWGEVVHGLKRGRELGYPTANPSPPLNRLKTVPRGVGRPSLSIRPSFLQIWAGLPGTGSKESPESLSVK